MGFDIARAAEPVAGKPVLDTSDHAVDAGMAFTLKHGIEIAGALGPGPGDQVARRSASGSFQEAM